MRVGGHRLLALAALSTALVASAEKSAFNIHVDPSAGFGLNQIHFVSGATLKVDTALIKALGPLAPQIEGFGVSALTRGFLDEGSAFGGGVGARLRLFNDEQGYFFNPGQPYRGNLEGNLWLDAHLTYTSGGFGLGFDVGAGYEFSLVEGLSLGPVAKYMFNARNHLLLFGLSFTIGAPERVPEASDYDRDGTLGRDDQCMAVPGPKANHGCPVTDQDGDGVGDHLDACATQAEDRDGYQDEDGCPELDNDADALPDAEDACPTEKGLRSNRGCPDQDVDHDTVPDQLDNCAQVLGEPDNAGCPWPDADDDGLPDRYDNCPKADGPASNSGCPGITQWVQLARGKLVIKDQVFFDVNRATLMSKSDPLLDQIAAILAQHPEIKLVQIEGHTDSAGDAINSTQLSQARADSVKAVLVKKGVASDRLKAVGFGPDRPIDTNETAEGRQNNRRIDFTVLQYQ